MTRRHYALRLDPCSAHSGVSLPDGVKVSLDSCLAVPHQNIDGESLIGKAVGRNAGDFSAPPHPSMPST